MWKLKLNIGGFKHQREFQQLVLNIAQIQGNAVFVVNIIKIIIFSFGLKRFSFEKRLSPYFLGQRWWNVGNVLVFLLPCFLSQPHLPFLPYFYTFHIFYFVSIKHPLVCLGRPSWWNYSLKQPSKQNYLFCGQKCPIYCYEKVLDSMAEGGHKRPHLNHPWNQIWNHKKNYLKPPISHRENQVWNKCLNNSVQESWKCIPQNKNSFILTFLQ